MKTFILIHILFISLSLSQTIESVFPTKISGGTGELITIKGKNFGNENTGQIYFYSYTDNGYDYYHVLDTLNFWYYGETWNDTLIITELPSFANSGYVFVKNKKESNRINYRVNFKYLGSKWNHNCQFVFYDNCPNGKRYFNDLVNIKDWNSDKFSYSFIQGETTLKQNGINEIGWSKIMYNHCLAITKTYTDNGINECDIILNSDIDWNYIDFKIVMLHELGHGLGLDDLESNYDKFKVMYANYTDSNARYLSISDIEGYNWIYKASLTNVKQKREEKMDFTLKNFPNPFNLSTRIFCNIPKNGNLEIVIYNSLGQETKTINANVKSGIFYDDFKAESSGVYFAVLFFNNKLVNSLKMIAIK
jgi:hypothetical protein